MKIRTQASLVAVLFGLGLAGCADMTPTEKGTVAGAAIGGVAGNALTGGSTLGTVGGAVAGGVIGHEIGEKREGR